MVVVFIVEEVVLCFLTIVHVVVCYNNFWHNQKPEQAETTSTNACQTKPLHCYPYFRTIFFINMLS